MVERYLCCLARRMCKFLITWFIFYFCIVIFQAGLTNPCVNFYPSLLQIGIETCFFTREFPALKTEVNSFLFMTILYFTIPEQMTFLFSATFAFTGCKNVEQFFEFRVFREYRFFEKSNKSALHNYQIPRDCFSAFLHAAL